MSTYHLTMKRGSRGKAANHTDYIMREGRHSNESIAYEFVTAETFNLPPWAETAKDFFRAADRYERSNGNAYTEFEIALPMELSLEENQKLIRQFIEETIGTDKVVAYAIHNKIPSLEEAVTDYSLEGKADTNYLQPHVHIMFSERCISDKENMKSPNLFFKRADSRHPERGGYAKDRRFSESRTKMSSFLTATRKKWADLLNVAYEKNNLRTQVSHLSLIDQKKEAEKAGDWEKAATLDREKPVRLSIKSFRKFIAILSSNITRQEKLERLSRSDGGGERLFRRLIQKTGTILARIDLERKRKAKELEAFGESFRPMDLTGLLGRLNTILAERQGENTRRINRIRGSRYNDTERLKRIIFSIASQGLYKKIYILQTRKTEMLRSKAAAKKDIEAMQPGTAGYNKAVSVYRSAEKFIAELNLKLKKLQVEMQSKYNNSDTEAKIKRISSRFEAVRKSFLEKASSLEKDNRQLENIAERNLDICGRLKSEARYTNPDTILTKEEGKALERAVTELKEAPEKEQAVVKINASLEKISSVLDDRKEARKEKTDDKIYKHKTDKEYGY